MIRGLYTAASGMMLQQAREDVVANNLANVDTSGFKKDLARAQSFPMQPVYRLGEEEKDAQHMDQPIKPVYIGELGTGAVVHAVTTDHTQGRLKETKNPTDVALTEEGYFFAVDTPQGVRYTRDGAFKINQQGTLVNNTGYPVMVDNGSSLQITGGEFFIDDKGRAVTTQNGNQQVLGNIAIFKADSTLMEKRGDNLYEPQTDPEAVDLLTAPTLLKSGYLEGSNVNAIREMVDMIEVVRVYEMNQKVAQSEDSLLDMAINTVGRV
ncbi:MAG: flagellar basal-body rod protein FlgF [Methylocystaceae bacterium]